MLDVNIGNNSSVCEPDKSIINKVAVNRAGVEDGEISVLDTRPSEIRVRISTSMESHAINRVALLATPLYCHSISYRSILDISGHLSLPLLIDKDELIMIGVCIIIDHPSIPGMISILINLDAYVSDTSRCSHILNRVGSKIRALSIRLNHVDKRGDPSKMDNGVVCVNGNGRDVFRSGSGEGGDIREEFVSPDLHSIIKQRVTLPIAQDSSTKGCSPFYLFRIPKVSSPHGGRRGTSSVSGSSSEVMRGVEEFYLFVGTDN